MSQKQCQLNTQNKYSKPHPPVDADHIGWKIKEIKTGIGVVLECLSYNLLITKGKINFILCGFA